MMPMICVMQPLPEILGPDHMYVYKCTYIYSNYHIKSNNIELYDFLITYHHTISLYTNYHY